MKVQPSSGSLFRSRTVPHLFLLCSSMCCVLSECSAWAARCWHGLMAADSLQTFSWSLFWLRTQECQCQQLRRITQWLELKIKSQPLPGADCYPVALQEAHLFSGICLAVPTSFISASSPSPPTPHVFLNREHFHSVRSHWSLLFTHLVVPFTR